MQTAVDRPEPAGSLPGALLLWLLIQLAVLGISVAQVSLSAQFTRPVEALALQEMLVVQIAATAALFPVLLQSPGMTAAIAATSWPFLQLCGILSSTPAGHVIQAAAYLSAWITALSLFRFVLPRGKSQMVGSAVTAIVALGGPLLWYLQAEFAATQHEVNWATDGLMGPIMGGLAIVNRTDFPTGQWVEVGIGWGICIAAAIVLCVKRRRTNQGR